MIAEMDLSCKAEQLASARTQRILDKIHDAKTLGANKMKISKSIIMRQQKFMAERFTFFPFFSSKLIFYLLQL